MGPRSIQKMDPSSAYGSREISSKTDWPRAYPKPSGWPPTTTTPAPSKGCSPSAMSTPSLRASSVRPANCPAVQLAKRGFVSAVEEVFAGDGRRPLNRDEEERLIPQAVAGSVGARRRIIDAYAELATLFALKIRPRSVSETRAVRVVQQELDRLVTFPSEGPLLASLVEGITKNLVP